MRHTQAGIPCLHCRDDIFEIMTALKLRIANEFLQLSGRPDFEQQFADGLKLYDSIPWQIMQSFVADDQVGQIGAPLVMSAVDPATMQLDKHFASVETGSSFGEFCKSMDPTAANYWQRIYDRIGIEFTDSPQVQPNSAVRWICVLPGALLCVVLVAFPVHWVVQLVQMFGRSDDSFITVDGKNLLAAIPPEHLERFGQALFAPFAFVCGGAWIAPSQRFRTGIILAVTLVALLVVLHTYVALANLTLAGGWFQRGLTHLLRIGGLSWGVYRAHEMDKKA